MTTIPEIITLMGVAAYIPQIIFILWPINPLLTVASVGWCVCSLLYTLDRWYHVNRPS